MTVSRKVVVLRANLGMVVLGHEQEPGAVSMGQVVHQRCRLLTGFDSHRPWTHEHVGMHILPAGALGGTLLRADRPRAATPQSGDARRHHACPPSSSSRACRRTNLRHASARECYAVLDTQGHRAQRRPALQPEVAGRVRPMTFLLESLTEIDGAPAAMALYGEVTYDSRVRKEARSLAEAGYDVTIVCLASGDAGSDLPANVTVLVRVPAGALVIPGSSNPFFTSRCESHREGPQPRSLARRLCSRSPELGPARRRGGRSRQAWHAHDLTALAAIVPSLPRRVPLVYDSHELYLESGTAAALPRLARWILRYYEKRLVSRVAALITVNDEIAGWNSPPIPAARHGGGSQLPAAPHGQQPAGSLIRDATAPRR